MGFFEERLGEVAGEGENGDYIQRALRRDPSMLLFFSLLLPCKGWRVALIDSFNYVPLSDYRGNGHPPFILFASFARCDEGWMR